LSEAGPGNGTLYLVPVDLGGDSARAVLPPATLQIVHRLESFVAENAKSARAFLKAAGHPLPPARIQIRILDEHTTAQETDALLSLLLAGSDCGLVSEAGCPAVADPGAALVRRAHAAGIRVVPLAGPSSILLALMASGMDGQHFAFHGYLPIELAARARRIRALDDATRLATQIFIETPYRNDSMLRSLLEHCRPDTRLCIAADLTQPSESVETRAVSEWKKKPLALGRRLVVFLLGG